jgi:hypothetical protein
MSFSCMKQSKGRSAASAAAATAAGDSEPLLNRIEKFYLQEVFQISTQPAAVIQAVEGSALENGTIAVVQEMASPSAAATAVKTTTVIKASGATSKREKGGTSPPSDGFRQARIRTGNKAFAENRLKAGSLKKPLNASKTPLKRVSRYSIRCKRGACLLYGCSCCRYTSITFCTCFFPGTGRTSAFPRI